MNNIRKISYSFTYKNFEADVRDLFDNLSLATPPEVTLYAAQVKGVDGNSGMSLPAELPLILGGSEESHIKIKISGRQLKVEKELISESELNLSESLEKIKSIADDLISVFKNKISGFSISFCGIVGEGYVETTEDATNLLQKIFLQNRNSKNDIFNLRYRVTYQLQNIYFVNLLLANARTNKDINRRIYFNVDVNTRYIANYKEDFIFDTSYEDKIVELSEDILNVGIRDFIAGGDLYDAEKFNGNLK